MTGPEHYAEAEYLLASSIHLRAELLSGDRENGPADHAEPDRVVALAQVHATLALTAATAAGVGLAERDKQSWDAAIGIPPSGPEVAS